MMEKRSARYIYLIRSLACERWAEKVYNELLKTVHSSMAEIGVPPDLWDDVEAEVLKRIVEEEVKNPEVE